jgi:hypothetical protein
MTYAFATPEWIMRTDWRLILLYWDYAREKIYQQEKDPLRGKPDLEGLKNLKLGKIIQR